MRLKPTFETDVYISAGGYFAISQTHLMGEEEVVLLSPINCAPCWPMPASCCGLKRLGGRRRAGTDGSCS